MAIPPKEKRSIEPMTAPLIEVGFVLRAHGVHGQARIALHNKDSTAFDFADCCLIAGVEYKIDEIKLTEEGVIAGLGGVSSREQAEALKGKSVHLFRDDLHLEDGEYFLCDLVGLKVVCVSGEDWGRITSVVPGAQHRLVIGNDHTVRELPLVDAFVRKIDWQKGEMTIDPPEGLPERATS